MFHTMSQGSAAVTAAVLELASFHNSDDGILTVRALHHLGVAVGGHAATAFTGPAHIGGLFNPHSLAFIAHHGGSRLLRSSG